MVEMTVNLVAVLASGIVSMVLGMLWYGPLFGKKWMQLSGIKEPSKEEQGKIMGKMLPSMAGGFVAALVMAYVLSMFVKFVGAATPLDGALVGFWAWLGFIATVTMSSVLWEGKPVQLYVLNNGHELVHFLLVGAIIAAMG